MLCLITVEAQKSPCVLVRPAAGGVGGARMTKLCMLACFGHSGYIQARGTDKGFEAIWLICIECGASCHLASFR